MTTSKNNVSKFGVGFCGSSECPFYLKPKCVHEVARCQIDKTLDLKHNNQMFPNMCPLLQHEIVVCNSLGD